MNIYDFDNTILRGDSTVLFVLRRLRKDPALLTRLPKAAFLGCALKLGFVSRQKFKEYLFRTIMPRLQDPGAEINAFWEENMDRVKAFYARTRKEDDVVISASPEFLILPVCERLGIRCVMATPVDVHTGRYLGANCHGEEKVRRFRERFPDAVIHDFYSDSHSDDPLAAVSRRSFLVKGEKLLPWTK